jgi:O-antigen ligase
MNIYLLVLMCLVILASIVLLPNVNKSIKARYVKAFEDAKSVASNLISKDSSNDQVDIRIRIWQDAFNKFKINPLLGAGFGISYHDKIRSKSWVHPHNIFLEILTELGIVGLCIFLLLFGLIFGKIFLILKHISPADRMIFFFYPLSLFFFFCYSMLHTDLSTEYFKWYFAGIITGFKFDRQAAGSLSVGTA